MVSNEFAVLVLSTCDSIVHDQPLHLGTLQHLHTHTTAEHAAVDCKSVTGLPAATSLLSFDLTLIDSIAKLPGPCLIQIQ